MTFPRISLLLLVSALGFLFQLPISAATPPPVVPHWDQTPLIKSSETRTTLALDGVWKFAPAPGTAGQPPSADDWGWITSRKE